MSAAGPAQGRPRARGEARPEGRVCERGREADAWTQPVAGEANEAEASPAPRGAAQRRRAQAWEDPASASAAARAPSLREPVTLLIAALGGQGGGVLTDWIVQAARAEGFGVQATSTPGVSQRTGATTYYVEIAAAPAPGAPAPVLGLAPVPGRVDVLVCAELLEAARMLERGMSTPSRTLVVASTHRVYTTREKMSGGDARFDGARIVEAVRTLSRRAALFDMDAIGSRHGSAISAALFGALAGSGALPMRRATCDAAIRAAGKGVAASVAAFDEAFARAQEAAETAPAEATECATARGAGPPGRTAPPTASYGAASPAVDDGAPALPELPVRLARSAAALPDRVAEFARIGAAQLLEYQGAGYAADYLDRVARIVVADARARRPGPPWEVARETARFLALWMRYDDVIRVASCKARASRLARIRGEAAAGAASVVRVHDFFKPGALEIAAILPRPIGTWLERRALGRRPAGRGGASPRGRSRGVTVQTSSVAGMLALRLIAALRPLRPLSLRYARERQAIEAWLAAIEASLGAADEAGRAAAPDLARLPRLIRGYGDTQASGRANFDRILAAWREHGAADPARAAETLRADALASLNDPGCGPGVASGPAAARPAAASSPA